MPKLAAVACPHCAAVFEPRRSNMKFCCANCRKRAHQKSDREINPVNSTSSKSKKRDNTELFDKACRLAEMLHTLPLQFQLGFLKTLVDDARQGNTKLKTLLCNTFILNANSDHPYLFYMGETSSPTIVKAADLYCRKFWGAGVVDVVTGKTNEPETGEIKACSENASSSEVGLRDKNVLTISYGRPTWQEVAATEHPLIRNHIPLSEFQRFLRQLPKFQRRLSEFDISTAA